MLNYLVKLLIFLSIGMNVFANSHRANENLMDGLCCGCGGSSPGGLFEDKSIF